MREGEYETTNDDGPAEEWRPVVGYEGTYEVSDQGRIRSLTRTVNSVSGTPMTYSGKVLRPWPDQRRRRLIVLSKNGEQRMDRVYRCVARAFVPNPDGKPEVNHLNGDPGDDRAENLEWCTREENLAHAAKLGLSNTGPGRRGEGHPHSKLTERDVMEAREMAKTDRPAAVRFLMDRGVNNPSAYAAIAGRSWAHLPVP